MPLLPIDAPSFTAADGKVRIDRIVAVAVLDDDGESVGAELSHQPHLSRLHSLHRCPDSGGDADAVPADDSPAGKGIPPEPIDDGSLHRPVQPRSGHHDRDPSGQARPRALLRPVPGRDQRRRQPVPRPPRRRGVPPPDRHGGRVPASSTASTPASTCAPGSTPTSAPPGSNAPNHTSSARCAPGS